MKYLRITICFVLILFLYGVSEWQTTASSDSLKSDSLKVIHSIVCPKCGTENLAKAHFCMHCGERLQEGKLKEGAEGDPNRTRVFIMPTGETLRKERGYFGSYEILYTELAYGLAPNFMLSGGMTLIPGGLVLCDINSVTFFGSHTALSQGLSPL
ncbi:MAG: zinc ribbon domain-containing protein [Candidatus Edwardsbacteria bacterium]